ncbi:hypothetical protein C8Q77DRAFT_1056078 [Trametes polyzona]|nr:hypothetical protein C8Q77DRAFT_1056078 [Trametes polyzona]
MRNQNFWHLDGSVVIQVQTTLFRLHRSRLAQHSDYFAALFENRQGSLTRAFPSSGQDTVDSCPVYVIKNVSVLDFERLLTALDAGIAYAIKPPPFRVLASLVRAAHTLSFKDILQFATHMLRDMWPSDLQAVDRMAVRPDAEQLAQATETILLAKECNFPKLLKAAYYTLLRTPDFGQSLAVYVHAESEAAGRSRVLERECDADEENAPPARLAASDLVRLVHARASLQREWSDFVRAPPSPTEFLCPLAQHAHPDGRVSDALRRCDTARARAEMTWEKVLVADGVYECGVEDVFAGLQRLKDTDWGMMGYCIGCVSERWDAWDAKRQQLWDWLDVLLGLKAEGV